MIIPNEIVLQFRIKKGRCTLRTPMCDIVFVALARSVPCHSCGSWSALSEFLQPLHSHWLSLYTLSCNASYWHVCVFPIKYNQSRETHVDSNDNVGLSQGWLEELESTKVKYPSVTVESLNTHVNVKYQWLFNKSAIISVSWALMTILGAVCAGTRENFI